MLMVRIVLAKVCGIFGSLGLVIKLNFWSDSEHKVWSRFRSWSTGEILKLKFGQYLAADARLRLWSLFLFKELGLVKILKFKFKTLRSYFGKQSSTLGSVVPLAMFFCQRASLEVSWKREPPFPGLRCRCFACSSSPQPAHKLFTWNYFKILTDSHTLRQFYNSKHFAQAHLNSQIRIQLEFALVDFAIGSLAQGVPHVKQVQGEDVRVPVLERLVLVSSSSWWRWFWRKCEHWCLIL